MQLTTTTLSTSAEHKRNSLDDRASPQSILELSALPASLVSFLHVSFAVQKKTISLFTTAQHQQ